MVPIPEEKCSKSEHNIQADSLGFQLSHPPPGDEVVITGIAGFYPESDSVQELQNNLFNKVDMVTSTTRGLNVDHPDVSRSTGKIKVLNRFDAQFFGVHFKQAWSMDPMCRMILEIAYEALIDAGVNPRELRNTKTGVFVGASIVEAERTFFYDKIQLYGFGLTGVSRNMLSNRISYWLGTTGPSYTIDTACSSSMSALDRAFHAIRHGLCDSAIVGGTNLQLHPYVSMQYHKMGFVSDSGQTKSFDKHADGYSRADTVSVLFLQKAKSARRVYAQLVYSKAICDGRYPTGNEYVVAEPALKHLLEECYQECSILPKEIEYIEAHGSGIRESDLRELRVIDEVFSKGRTDPLLIGSIKSNMGNSEAASGMCSITKLCLAYQSGYIAPNLHYSEPAEVEGLQCGRLQVVTEKTPWQRGYVAISNFGFGGVNTHFVLKNFAKPKLNGAVPSDDLPRLVCASGRSEEAIDVILEDLCKRPLDAEQVRLLHAIHENEIPGHVYRGYSVLAKGENDGAAVSLAKDRDYFPGAKRPIWFVYSGMGSQWSGMGAQLMRIPVFAEAIERCHKVLSPRGVDITRIITDPDVHMFDNILHSFVGIAAVQIGLTDVLRTVGIVPDHIIGHSVGELGCAYADDCFTAEQMILAAYSRGLASIETPFIKGSMAAVGLGYNEVKKLCPPEIEVACHNGPGSSTISGPANVMSVFVSDLKAKGIFAREVPCSNIAYHSKYIVEAGPTLLKYLKEVIPSPKPRSARWVSTSVPQGQWGEEGARYSSAEYHTNNLLSPVLFEETCRVIPYNAITIEIAPHGLLQAILRPTLHKDCTNIPLTKRGHPDNVEFMFTALGKLYQEGLNLQLSNLYPRVEFPVSAGTPMLSHLVRWEHSEDWFVPFSKPQSKAQSGERHVRLCLVDDEWTYMSGHVINGVNIFPASGFLVLVWETLGFILEKPYTSFSVIFEDVTFKKTSRISPESGLDVGIMIQKGTGNFEVIENDEIVVSGRVDTVNDAGSFFTKMPEEFVTDVLDVESASVYKELAIRGYSYSGAFQSILSSDLEAKQAFLRWNNNWVTFLDGLLQVSILARGRTSGDIVTPVHIGKVIIDVNKHQQTLSDLPDDVQTPFVQAVRDPEMQILRAGGVEIRNLHKTIVQRRLPQQTATLQKFDFVSHFGQDLINVKDVLRVNIHLAVENHSGDTFRVVELSDPARSGSISSMLEEILEEMMQVDFDFVNTERILANGNAQLVVGADLLIRPKLLEQTWGAIREGGFILSRESSEPRDLALKNIDVITSRQTELEHFVLFRKRRRPASQTKFIPIRFDDRKFNWFTLLQSELAKDSKVVLVSEGEQSSGVLGLVKCLNKEPRGGCVRAIVILDPKAPAFKGNLELYKKQLDKGLAINQYQNGNWCSYIGNEITDSISSDHASLVVHHAGNLSSLAWIQGEFATQPKINYTEKMVQVYYAGVSYQDVMTATKRIPLDERQEGYLGYEFSGRLSSGKRVMGVVPRAGLSTAVKASQFLWDVPANWSLEDAATVPLAYTLAFYALLYCGKLQPKASVLIHGGAGALGQAVINVCLHLFGCNVFTTVSSQEKRDFIRKTFPQIKESHILSSKDANFEAIVKQETQGKGVQIVLYNALSEDMFQESANCLSYSGYLLNLSQFDIHNNTTFRMGFLIKESHCCTISLNTIRPDEIDSLKKTISMGLECGIVRPLHRTVYTASNTEAAFRHISTRENLGRVLIGLRQEEQQMIVEPNPHQMLVKPRYYGEQYRSYVVSGGLAGFGLELADWLVRRGVRNIVLHSQCGLTNGYQRAKLQKWRSLGVSVRVSRADVSNEAGCTNLLEEANELAPVRAIFLASEPADEDLLQEPTAEHLARIVTPRVAKTNNLDIASRKICRELKDFVVFVRAQAGAGAGAVARGLCDGELEAVCARRRRAGLAGTAVRWGSVGEAGLNIDGERENWDLHVEGTSLQSIQSALKSLDTLLHQNSSVVSSAILPSRRKLAQGSTMMEEVGKILGLDLAVIPPHLTLLELGLDTPTSVELSCLLHDNFHIHLTPTNIKKLTFAKLNEMQEQLDARQTTTEDNDMKGINMLLRHVVHEFEASEYIIDLPTAVSHGEIEEERYTSGLTMFLVSGLDGAPSVFQSICHRLKVRAALYQLGVDFVEESIQDSAKRLTRHITSHLPAGANFYLLSYSFGVQVALEIAMALENKGYVGKVFCLDGSPDYFKALLTETVRGYSEDTLENIVISRLHELMTTGNSNDLERDLQNCRDLEGKIALLLKRVPSSVKLSKQYKEGLVKAALNRIRATKSYESKGVKKLKSSIVLLRIKDEVHGLSMDHDYGLGKYSEQDVKVHILEGNHVTVTENRKCSTIINTEMADYIDIKAVNSCINYFHK